jgi:hypothetical protein
MRHAAMQEGNIIDIVVNQLSSLADRAAGIDLGLLSGSKWR